MGTLQRRLRLISACTFVAAAVLAAPATASVTVSPAAVTVKPGQATSLVGVTLTFPPATDSGSGTVSVVVTGALSGHATVDPAPVSYDWASLDTVSSTGFRLLLAPTAPPGSYAVTVIDDAMGAGSANLVVTVEQPEFSFQVIPGQVTLAPGDSGRTVTVRTFPEPGFSQPVTYAVEGFPPFIQSAAVVAAPPAYADRSLQISLGPGAVPGSYGGAVRATAPGLVPRNMPLTVHVEDGEEPPPPPPPPPGPAFTFDVAPNPVRLRLGGRGAEVTVTTHPEAGFTAPITYALEDLPGFLGAGPAQTSGPPAYPPLTFQVEASEGAAVGRFTGSVRASGPTFGSRRVPLTVIVAEPELSFSVAPESVELRLGGRPAAVTVSTQAGGLTLPVTYVFRGLPSFVRTGAPRTSAPPLFPDVVFDLSLGPGATTGSFDAVVEARVAGASPVRRPVEVRVLPPLPVVERIVPRAVAAGSVDVPLRLHGRDFAPGARIVSGEPFVRVGAVRFLSPSLLEVLVSARADAGRRLARLRVRNPDGATSPGPVPLAVVDRSSLTAPVAVQTAAVASPLPGAHVSTGEALYPRGVLGVAGTGTIVGSWLLDGIPFDRFVVRAVGGEPVAVVAEVPIPTGPVGRHSLQLAVETPQEVVSEPVLILRVTSRASSPRSWAPRDGQVVAPGDRPLLRWTKVPGAADYLVEVSGEDGQRALEVIVGGSSWRPAAADLTRMGPGVVRWTVRSRAADGTPGAATAERRLILLPERVTLTLLAPAVSSRGEARLLRWRGGAPGLLYRIDFLDVEGDEVRFSALTARQDYRVPRPAPAEGRVRVTALGPGGEELGRSPVIDWSPVRSAAARGFALASDAPSIRILEQVPPAGTSVEEPLPEIAARWSGSLPLEDVVLVLDTTDVTGLSELTASSIVYRPPHPLAAGAHRVRLWLGERMEEWSFDVGVAEAGEYGAVDGDRSPGPPQDDLRDHWRVALEGDLRQVGGGEPVADETVAHAALSAAVDLQSSRAFAAVAGDVALSRNLDADGGLDEENRNWVAALGAPRRDGTRLEAEGGYFQPAFLAGTALLALGLPKGGIRGTAAAGAVELSYFETFDPNLAGLATGSFGPEQQIRSAAVALPGAGAPLEMRVIGLEVDESDGPFFFGGESKLLGLVGTYRGTSGTGVSLELAEGEYAPNPGSLEERSEGLAGRLAVSSRVAGFDLGLRVHFTEADFVNRANQGLTAVSVPDRAGGDLTVGRSWTRGSFSLRYRHLEGGTASGVQSPEARQDGGELAVHQRLGNRVTLRVSSNLTRTTGEADEELLLPAVERTDWGARLALSESLGTLTVSQDLSFQESDDENDPDRFSEVMQAGLALSGAVADGLSVFGRVTAVRNRSGATALETETLLVSLQPTWAINRIGLNIQPYLSYNRQESELADEPTETENYRLTLSWDAPWLGSFLSLHVSGDWRRTRGPGIQDADFTARYTGALTLRWDWNSTRSGGRPFPFGVQRAVIPPPLSL